jgi:hypothetical protein
MRCNIQVRKSYPYLTTDRFPHNWAIADMVKGYIAGTRKDHHRQAREEEGERKGKSAPGRLKKGPKDSNTDDSGDNEDDEDEVPPPSSSTKARKSKKSAGPKDSNTDDTGDNEDDEDEVPPPSSSTKARKSKKSAESNPVDVEMPRSSSSSKSGKSTSRSAASRDNDSDSIDETTARPRPGGKSRKRVRDLAAVDDSDLEETPIKKPRPSSRRTSKGEEDNGEDQGGLGSDVYAD